MAALNSRVARLEKQVSDNRPPVSTSLFTEWFLLLHQAVNQVEDWNNPPLGCMGMKDGHCYRWVITIPQWNYWCRKINLVNGRDILQTEYDTPAAAAETFKLGAALVNQAHDNVVSGRN